MTDTAANADSRRPTRGSVDRRRPVWLLDVAATGSLDWHFDLDDKVQDKILIRYIFEVPEDKDIGKVSDEIAGRVFDMAEKLAEFGGYFIWSEPVNAGVGRPREPLGPPAQIISQ